VGLQWADAFLKGNTLGMAFGQPTFATSQFKGKPNDGNYAWEWWYKFQVTDNISVTPAIYYLSAPLGAIGREVAGGNALTNFGGLVKTTFKF
jgi:carbohydrate-selective porin OprB